jgi:hypothetical protein
VAVDESYEPSKSTVYCPLGPGRAGDQAADTSQQLHDVSGSMINNPPGPSSGHSSGSAAERSSSRSGGLAAASASRSNMVSRISGLPTSIPEEEMVVETLDIRFEQPRAYPASLAAC